MPYDGLIKCLEQKNGPTDLLLQQYAINCSPCVLYPNLIIPDVSDSKTGMGKRNNINFYTPSV